MRAFWWIVYCAIVFVAVAVSFRIACAQDQEQEFDPPRHQETPGYPPINPPPSQDFDHQVVLTLTVITPGEQPNINRSIKQKSLDECWESAKAWVQTENIGQKVPNSIGVGAGCGVVKRPSQEP